MLCFPIFCTILLYFLLIFGFVFDDWVKKLENMHAWNHLHVLFVCSLCLYRNMKSCSVSFLHYLKILVAFFLFVSASTPLTSFNPLKEYKVWLFLVHILFVCFFFFWFSLVPLCSGLCSFSLVFWCTWSRGSELMDLLVGERWSWVGSWGMR